MREHIEHILAAAGAVGLALFVSYFNTGVPLASKHAPVVAHPSPASLAVETASGTAPDIGLATSTFENLFPAPPSISAGFEKPGTTTQPITTPAVEAPAVKPAEPKKTLPATTPAATIAPPAPAAEGPSAILTTLSRSVVNILCTSHTNQIQGSSGSGVIIDSRGIILTVAHVAQAELLEEALGSDVISCVIRTGNPAQAAYTARVIYLPKAWVEANPTALISSSPTGTGEDDFALLAITGSATASPLPSSYPAVNLSSSLTSVGDEVGVGAYGGQYLTSAEVRTALAPTLASGAVDKVSSFTGHTSDALSVSAGSAAQEGASGGAVVNTNGQLAAIIVGSYTPKGSSGREMWAITVSYIGRAFTAASGVDLNAYLSKGVPSLVASYTPTAENLGQFIGKSIGLSN